MRVKLLVCLLFLALVSAMVLFSKYLLLALIYGGFAHIYGPV